MSGGMFVLRLKATSNQYFKMLQKSAVLLIYIAGKFEIEKILRFWFEIAFKRKTNITPLSVVS
jgi:hypothetical protein